MDMIIPALASEGVPILILLYTMRVTGLKGGARLTTALASIGPGGMFGGLCTLATIQLAVLALTKAGIDTIYRRVLRELLRRGETPTSLSEKIDKYHITDTLKAALKHEITLAL